MKKYFGVSAVSNSQSNNESVVSIQAPLKQETFFSSVEEYESYVAWKQYRSKGKQMPNYNNRSISLYANHSATFRLIISGDIETNPGPNLRLSCSVCQKNVRKNSYHLECNLSHVKCTRRNYKVKRHEPKFSTWTCNNCLLTELPFCNADINDCVRPEAERQIFDLVVPMCSRDHRTILIEHRNQLSICHLNIQSMKNSTAQLEAMLSTYQFDILTLSETWLVENPALLNQMSFSGYQKFKYNNRAERGGGVGTYFIEGLKNKPRTDIEKKDPSIEHQWFEVRELSLSIAHTGVEGIFFLTLSYLHPNQTLSKNLIPQHRMALIFHTPVKSKLYQN